MTPKLKRTLALALAGGSLAIGVPAALAAGGGDDAGSSAAGAPSYQVQDQQRPDRGPGGPGDCPEHDGGSGSGPGQQDGSGSGSGSTTTPNTAL